MRPRTLDVFFPFQQLHTVISESCLPGKLTTQKLPFLAITCLIAEVVTECFLFRNNEGTLI